MWTQIIHCIGQPFIHCKPFMPFSGHQYSGTLDFARVMYFTPLHSMLDYTKNLEQDNSMM